MYAGNIQSIYNLAIALALGLIIGVEREWRERHHEGGIRPAGVRTFGLISLSGGVLATLGTPHSNLAFIGIASVVLIMTIAYWRRSPDDNFMGVTTIFAAIIAYGCGGLAVSGQMAQATAVAVATALILSAKERFHRFVAKLKQKEIFATLQFLLIAGVILPIIPNTAFGPYDAINPFEIWLMVVLISGISFIGYISAQILSPQTGIIGMAILGGLVSSTAVTLSLSRIARKQTSLYKTISIGIVVASVMMIVRVAVIATAVFPPLIVHLFPPIAAMALVGITYCLLNLKHGAPGDAKKLSITNPLELPSAVFFASLIIVIMLTSRWLEEQFGPKGVFVLAFASGLADVDAVTLSLARFAQDDLSLDIAATGILIATATNIAVKAALTLVVGNMQLARTVSVILIPTVILGFAAMMFFV